MQGSTLKFLSVWLSQFQMAYNYFKCFQIRPMMTLNCLNYLNWLILFDTLRPTFSMALISEAIASFSSFIAKSIYYNQLFRIRELLQSLSEPISFYFLSFYHPKHHFYAFINQMYNKSEEENDYLESLFLKPFCERYVDEPIPLKQNKIISSQVQNKITRKQACHIYNPVAEQQQIIIRKMSVNDNRCRQEDHSKSAKANKTPYLNRKNQEKGIAQEIRKKQNEKNNQLPASLQISQKNWLIIREMQARINEFHKNKTELSSYEKAHQRGESSEQRRHSLRSQGQGHRGEDSKNVKTMMSYYKNKRLIKHMTKIGNSINLTNSQIQQSINLRIQNVSANKKDQNQNKTTEKIKLNSSKKKKMYLRQKGIKTEHSISSNEKIKVRLIKTLTFNNLSGSSFQLKDFLRSSKIDMSMKQNRPKTQVRLKRSQHISHSKNQKIMNSMKCNQVTGWQHTSQKHEAQSVLLSD